ncbi:ABC transporter ATP-binding protein [Jiangella asiatica]|uniref:Dipeptide ABC transporter ATP-binding protein n=1 Tax=Jiangella asiatica TaxID=2530372 RepID=A0A4R5DK36_9ACTN|nr:dipeptide ABC transporter ATP-binding protein [Jiangella asiatica]TDE11205.1 dipeptide ABC transporter ATP-binding protein [Jiangella asiatica]
MTTSALTPAGTPAGSSMGRAGGEILRVENLTIHFPVRSGLLGPRQTVQAVNDVSFTIGRGETLGLVGESGCGKSTTGLAVIRRLRPTSGRIVFDGRDISTASRSALRPVRRNMQFVFQDPAESLNPRMTTHEIIAEPLRIHGRYDAAGPAKVAELMERCGLDPRWSGRLPHEFSGGQRQRIGIARALALDPSLLILDEPVSALDVSVQAQIVNLLVDLQRDLGLSYLFIAHDLAVVRHISHRVAVMYLGRIVEYGEKDQIYRSPRHPYTQALLSSVPAHTPAERNRPGRIKLTGDVPSPLDPPSGCHFHTRCPKAIDRCSHDDPALDLRGGRQLVACHLAEPGADHQTQGER